MRVLGIETSCDETGIAVYEAGHGILAQRLHSQAALHARYGGVVPELASRDHITRIGKLMEECIAAAGIERTDLDAVAYTAGPGLIGALLVGASVGRSLAYSLGIPAVAVNHMEAHLLAVRLEEDSPDFPFIALLVSGGHTQLVAVEDIGRYTLLGESLDDAAGEAFDKTAMLLGLGYPGGPAIAALAERGHAGVYNFPRPMTDRPGLDFSFSGLKTAVALAIRELDDDEQARADLAHGFVEAVVDTLAIKCRRAMDACGINRLVAAGGVSANQQLRTRLQSLAGERDGRVYFPRPEYCTDNGAMIAYAGYVKLQSGAGEPLAFAAHPRWPVVTAER